MPSQTGPGNSDGLVTRVGQARAAVANWATDCVTLLAQPDGVLLQSGRALSKSADRAMRSDWAQGIFPTGFDFLLHWFRPSDLDLQHCPDGRLGLNGLSHF